jgi:hypothetical protein
MTRKIKVLSTVGASGTIETNVTTVAELKPLLRQREINYQGMKMMVGETRNELNLDEAQLPEGDFKLYLMPAKTKSGSVEGVLAQISNSLNELADLFEALGDELTGSEDALIKNSCTNDPDMDDLRRLASGQSSERNNSNDWLG